MADRPPNRPKSLFARPRNLLVDDRPFRIEMPPPPPIQMAAPASAPIAPSPSRISPPSPVPAPGPAAWPSAPSPESTDDPPSERPGPARLFIGAPRAVSPVSVRAGFDARTDITDVEGGPSPFDPPVEGIAARAAPEGTELRFPLPRGDRVPSREKGLDRSARTVEATPERRVWVEEPEHVVPVGRELPAGRETIRPPATARARQGPLEPPLHRPAVAEVIGGPTRAPPTAPATTPVADVDADDAFFERPGTPGARLPERALQPAPPPVRTAHRRFVPRAPPPRRAVPAWAWGLAGVALLIAGVAGLWSQIRGEVMDAAGPVANVPPPASVEVVPEPETPRVPGGEEEPIAPTVDADRGTEEDALATPAGSGADGEGASAPVATSTSNATAPALPPAPVPPPVEAPVGTPAAAPAAAAESPLKLVGVLRIVSNAPGKIYIDGKYKAAVEEEATLELPAGVHDVKLVTRQGRAQTQKVRVDAGEARGVVFQIK